MNAKTIYVAGYECLCCGHEINVDQSKITAKRNRVACPYCNAQFYVDVDAEFDNGTWINLTKLVRV